MALDPRSSCTLSDQDHALAIAAASDLGSQGGSVAQNWCAPSTWRGFHTIKASCIRQEAFIVLEHHGEATARRTGYLLFFQALFRTCPRRDALLPLGWRLFTPCLGSVVTPVLQAPEFLMPEPLLYLQSQWSRGSCVRFELNLS